MNLTSRMTLLAAVTTATLSAAFLIPEAPPMKSSRLAQNLPDKFGDWHGEYVKIGERELAILAKDTSFERKTFTSWGSFSDPDVQVSIVFSGKDLNNSIHRPEICLRTQGWDFVSESYRVIPGGVGEEDFPVKEIICRRKRQDAEGKEVIGRDGVPLEDWQLLCYSFIGHERITPGHYQRTFADIGDRLLKGHDQSWAYATFSTVISGKYAEQGLMLGTMSSRTIEETRAFLDQFIGELMPCVVSPAP